MVQKPDRCSPPPDPKEWWGYRLGDLPGVVVVGERVGGPVAVAGEHGLLIEVAAGEHEAAPIARRSARGAQVVLLRVAVGGLAA